MILQALFWMLICTAGLVLSIVAHELGHAWCLRSITGKTPKVSITRKRIILGTAKDYEGLTDEEYKEVIWWGIVIGALQLVLFTAILLPAVLILILAPLYVYGCKGDIEKLRRLKNNGNIQTM